MKKLPDVARIETSGICNFECIHCPNKEIHTHRPILTNNLFSSIIQQFFEIKYIPRVAVLYHGGEPLLNKNIFDYIKILKNLGTKKTVITTNASLLDTECAEKLLKSGLDEIKISFDGKTPEENNFIRKNANFFKDAQNVINLIKLQKKIKTHTSIIISNVLILHKDEAKEEILTKKHETPDYLKNYFREYTNNIQYQTFLAMKWPGLTNAEHLNVIKVKRTSKAQCPALFETFTILSNGDVAACCYDIKGEKTFGNIYTNNITDIYYGEKFSTFRSDFINQKFNKLCLNCTKVNPAYLVYK
ncbi:MAG: radical SAM protein [Verrucomicrobiae bacterium]|nr:radical SAM protein [Verrucomicrobiae bacterium]